MESLERRDETKAAMASHGQVSIVLAVVSVASIAGAVGSIALAESMGSAHGLGRAFLTALMLFYVVAPISLLLGLGTGMAAIVTNQGRLMGIAGLLLNAALTVIGVYFLFFHWAV